MACVRGERGMKRVWLVTTVAASTAVSALAISAYRHRAENKTSSVPARTILYYRDPMHPSYTSDRPGKAPDCGMDLEPVYVGEPARATSGMVQVTPERQQMIGVRVVRVEAAATTQTLRTLGRVMADESRVFPMIAGGEGWVNEVMPETATGNTVHKGQPLAVVYGKDYTAAQRSFLYALRNSENKPSAIPGDVQDQPAFTLQEAELVLQNMGFGEAQIQQLMKIRKVMLETTLTAPGSGVVLARNIFPKQKFAQGAELFKIADLSHVWIVADMFGEDGRYIPSGSTAFISLPLQPEKKLRATVGEALPSFDSESRTFKLRLEAENPKLTLRPDMFVDVEFQVNLPKAIAVPAEAVIDSGREKTVYVARGQGMFEPRVVETGWRFGNRVQIVRGLQPGESVVVSGNFLLDSESRMRQADAGRHD